MVALETCYLIAKTGALDALWRVISLRDYNTRVVLLGTVLLGIGAGLLGVYLLLRRRVLIGDAIAHATLPGVVLAFLWTASSGADKSLGILLLGGAISGALGGLSVLALRHLVQIREDAALGIVLSVFFGAGACLLKIATFNSGGNAAGLESFIYGKAASMTSEHVWLIGGAVTLILFAIALLGKELQILCFDSTLARSQGWPILVLDSLLIGLVVAITIVGLQAVGLIMIIALLVVPAASARFWTHEMRSMLLISGFVGALSCAAGTTLSAVFAKLPSGATIVLCGCACFAISFAFGRERGVAWYLLRMRQLRIDQDVQHFLRATYEILETRNALPKADADAELKSSESVSLAVLRNLRNWATGRVRRVAWRLSNSGLVVTNGEEVRLTPRGYLQALSIVRDHRLIEKYMIEEAAAPVGVADRAADYLEHDLQPEHLDQLQRRVMKDNFDGVLPSPHELGIEAPSDPPTDPTQNDAR